MTSTPSAVAPTRLVERARTVALAAAFVAVFLQAMRLRLGPELADDGAFFLRYAENILRGEFWVWNRGEAPVWGASAPLYPLVVALPMALGVPPAAALVGTGMALMATALAITALVLRLHAGWIAALAFVAFAALDTGLMYFGGAGLESPLTVLLLALSVWAVVAGAGERAVGVIAGLLLIHKLDLVPAGGLLIAAVWLRDRRIPRVSLLICGALAASWYAFAWMRFGAPVPNSFLTKSLYQLALSPTIDWQWFGHYVLVAGFHRWLVLLALAALIGGRHVRALALLLFGIIAAHLVAYSVRFPFEPYNWYAVPSVYALCVLGAIGVGSIVQYFQARRPRPLVALAALALVTAIVAAGLAHEEQYTADVKAFSSYQESDRAEAGRWVDAHVPQEFRVYTMWGSPAYYSHRYVIDGSFLNRPFEDGNLVETYRPEILILQGDPGVLPAEPVFPAAGVGYDVVKVFAKSHTAGMDYFFAVLARHDALERISGRETTINLARYVRHPQPGDRFGTIKPQGLGLFVHPGASTSSRFELDTAAFLRDTGQRTLTIDARIAPNVPDEGIRRGAANVRVRVMLAGGVMGDVIVAVGRPQRFQLDATVAEPYQVIVDHNGEADFDWLILTAH